MQAIAGNVNRDPAAVLLSMADAGRAAGIWDDQTGQTGPVYSVTDSGKANGGDGGGNQPLVTCQFRHGLNPGHTVTLTGTGYDGTYIVEPTDDPTAFLIDNIAFAGETAGGSWA